MPNHVGDDRVSHGLMRFMDGLSPDEREELRVILRDPKTFIAEDLDDLMAILRSLNDD